MLNTSLSSYPAKTSGRRSCQLYHKQGSTSATSPHSDRQSNVQLFWKNIAAEEGSDALNLDGEVTEYSTSELDSETDMEDNPVHEEDSDSNLNVCVIHPFNI
ncbi:hypothetical protein AVEN_268058-1 [Araneus ventricosus]|uniref:Uncharacterized protein n=1 Tax=Araneus ventricosus TaxID=182803 RepID=A0A4Y2VW90_ARAVE|nr:hypothetical protein AVEN_268058-1 [Araneus ventricosus]